MAFDANYAKKLAQDKAKEAGLSKKEITAAGKAAVTDFYKNASQFKSAQEAELVALRDLRTKGEVTTSIINAEKKANAAEYKEFLKQYFAGSAGTAAGQSPADLRSAASAYTGDTVTKVSSLLDSAAQRYEDLNVPTKGKAGNTVVGLGLNNLVSYDLGLTNKGDTALIQRGETYVGKTFTPEELQASGVKIKEVKNAPGVFQWSAGGDERRNIVYFAKNADGTYTGSGINRTYTPQESSGFMGLGNIGSVLALGALGYFGGPALAGAVGTSGAVASGIAGGLLGAGASALGGYDPLKGALTAAGGGFAGGGGFASLGGGEATGAFDIAGNPDILGGNSAVGLGNITTGAFDMGGNPQIMDLPTGAFDVAGNPDILTGSSAYDLGNTTTGAFDIGGNPNIMTPVEPTTGAFDIAGNPDIMTPVEPTTGAFDVGGNPDILKGGAVSPISITDALRGINTVRNLMGGNQQQQVQQQGIGSAMSATGIDYSTLLGLLNARAKTSGLLGTQFQPQGINLASLLG